MIVSASRRTDIPKFHSQWFIDRVRAGSCTVPNPFNPRRVIKVSLQPEDVDVIVFWSKDPRPLMAHLHELDARGFRYYFQFTVNGYPRLLEPNVPPLPELLDAFARLAEAVSPERVIWRYDPIVWSNLTDLAYHERRFLEIATVLRGKTRRLVTSLVDDYAGARRRLASLSGYGIRFTPCTPEVPGVRRLLRIMVQVAADSGMEIVSCAEKYDLSPFGLRPGKCIDDTYVARVFGIDVDAKKDPGQRLECGCVRSKDIGVYGTCHHGCLYCYATGRPRATGRTGGPPAKLERTRSGRSTHPLYAWYNQT
ncbi:MAG TPA: DUF1848 domain-containing protein [Firmicutes bacterium]|nr:DUF1848 domain-containing protein [Bacillota bacterium]